ncbi:acyl-CoA thioesterase [Ramlibacter sp. WS9]|nr:acyl-CoA thioesterase [Ramlibacter sp. WS9]
MPTRWADNDSYGHVNNVVYYSFFDTAVNRHLIESGVLDIAASPVIALVIETRCTYFSSVGFPDDLDLGLKVVKLGNSSVQYEIGLFKSTAETASAVGYFTHVYVDRQTNRPVAIPDSVRSVLSELQVAVQDKGN